MGCTDSLPFNNLKINRLWHLKKNSHIGSNSSCVPPWHLAKIPPRYCSDLASLKALPSAATHWYQSERVRNFIEAERAAYQARKMKERERIEQEVIERQKEGQTTKKKFVDYSDPVNQRQKLNELINTATDPDEVLDALKVLISQGVKLPPENPNGNQRQIRAYLPLNCRECPLYIEAEKKLKK